MRNIDVTVHLLTSMLMNDLSMVDPFECHGLNTFTLLTAKLLYLSRIVADKVVINNIF